MQISQVIIENLGPFRGRHTFDVAPNTAPGERKPVILISGHNGAGKTTFLDAVRLCLHGQRALGLTSRQDYAADIRSRMHERPNGDVARFASVTLTIEHVEAGSPRLYVVERRWERDDRGNIAEHLKLLQDGEALDELYEDQYETFLNELVPVGLAEFFFFDGERIQRLARDDHGEELANSIRELLGLDLVAKLQSDLGYLLRNNGTSPKSRRLANDYQAAEAALGDIDTQITTLTAEQDLLEEQALGIERDIVAEETQLAAEGGEFASKRIQLIEERATWEVKLGAARTELADIAAGLLPFALAPKLSKALEQQLRAEAEALQDAAAAGQLEKRLDGIVTQFRDPTFWKQELGPRGSASTADRLATAAIRVVSAALAKAAPRKASPMVHDVSEGERSELLATLAEAQAELSERTNRASRAAEGAARKIQSINHSVDRTPSDEILAPILDRLREKQADLTAVRSHQAVLTDRVERLARDRERATNTLTRVGDQAETAGKRSKALASAASARSALLAFEQELSVRRVRRLNDEVTACFKTLSRKEDYCSAITFDPVSFATTFIGRDGVRIPKSRLSAGEKQIFAISVLWGLGRVAGREIPVIIDTPLARLDQEHRSRIVEHYFPHASHQVIILATDSEIDEAAFAAIEDSVAVRYDLQFDTEEGATTAVPGFFEMVRA